MNDFQFFTSSTHGVSLFFLLCWSVGQFCLSGSRFWCGSFDPNLSDSSQDPDPNQCFRHIIFLIWFLLFRFFVGQFPCGSFQHCYLPAFHVTRQSSLLRSRYCTWNRHSLKTMRKLVSVAKPVLVQFHPLSNYLSNSGYRNFLPIPVLY
jgi:hypothetical protein